MIKIYHKAIREHGLSELSAFKVGSWIYAENPTQEELDQLVADYKLDRGLLGDALDPYEVPRLEHEGTVTYVFTRIPLREGKNITTLPLLIALGENFLLTVCKKPLPFLDRFAQGKVDFFTTQKSRLFTQLISEINLAYQAFLAEISRNVRSMTVQFERIENRDIIRFVVFESALNDFIAVLLPTNRILESILTGRYFKLYEQDQELTQDVFLANGQLIESSKSNLKTITNFREAYSTIVTNDLNRVIKLLTSLTVVLAIPTMIASFYGMNVPLPFSNSPLAFFGILAVTVPTSVLVLTLFMSRRWL